jgi:hypothetical protein
VNDAAEVIREPRPFCRPPKYSATTAAITASDDACRRPVKTKGRAPGSRTLRAKVQPPAA